MSSFPDLWTTYCHEQGFEAATGADGDDDVKIIVTESGHLIVIDVEPIADAVLVKAVLAYLPLDEGNPADIYRQLLEAHLLGEATGGACFAIDPDADELIAYRRLPLATLDARQLATEINELATMAMRFAELLSLPAPATSVA